MSAATGRDLSTAAYMASSCFLSTLVKVSPSIRGRGGVGRRNPFTFAQKSSASEANLSVAGAADKTLRAESVSSTFAIERHVVHHASSMRGSQGCLTCLFHRGGPMVAPHAVGCKRLLDCRSRVARALSNG